MFCASNRFARAPSRNRWHVLRQRTCDTEFQNFLMPTDSPMRLKNPDPRKIRRCWIPSIWAVSIWHFGWWKLIKMNPFWVAKGDVLVQNCARNSDFGSVNLSFWVKSSKSRILNKIPSVCFICWWHTSSNSPKNKDFSHILLATVQGFLHFLF